MDRNNYQEDDYLFSNDKNNNDELGQDNLQPSLPSRLEVHGTKREQNKYKLKYPVIKALAIFFILLPVALYGWFTFASKSDQAKGDNSNHNSYETVGLNNDESKKDENLNNNENETIENDDSLEEISGDSVEQGEPDKPVQPNTKQPINIKPSLPDQPNNDTKVIAPEIEKQTPPKVEKPKDQTKPEPEIKEQGKVVYHTVKEKETLFRISMNYFNSQSGIEIIKRENNLQNDNINVGQVLKIPLDN